MSEQRYQLSYGGFLHLNLLQSIDPDSTVRQLIGAAFPDLFAELTIRRVMEEYGTGDATQRRTSLSTLGMLYPGGGTHFAAVNRKLGTASSEALLSLLRKALADPDSGVRMAAVRPLLNLDGETRFSMLGEVLASNDENVQREALNVLFAMANGAYSTSVPGLHLGKPEALKGAKALVPGLVHIVCQGKDWSVPSAVRYLAAIGEPARGAIPDLCAALDAKKGQGDFVARWNLAWGIRELSGGPESTAPYLVALLKDARPEVRRDVAATFGHLGDFQSQRVEKQPDGKYDKPLDDRTLQSGFFKALPDLATMLSDKEPAIRRAAANSLSRLAIFPTTQERRMSAPWSTVVSPLGRMLGDSDASVAREVAKAIATLPVALDPAVPELRRALAHPDKETRLYVTFALDHAIRWNRAAVRDPWRADLLSTDSTRRRAAAEEAEVIAPLLIGSYMWQVILADFDYWNSPLSQWQGPRVAMQDAPIPDTEREPLLKLLSDTLKDPDRATRIAIARAVVQLTMIGEREKPSLVSPPSLRTALKPLLTQAHEAMKNDDPSLAKQLEEIRRRYDMPMANF
jgi:HEAT repeat protein